MAEYVDGWDILNFKVSYVSQHWAIYNVSHTHFGVNIWEYCTSKFDITLSRALDILDIQCLPQCSSDSAGERIKDFRCNLNQF
jgi:hypothetical protein